ncbi:MULTISPECIES: DUF4412 domain-containing protein [Antarcticibacterium]|nr:MULTISPECIES: DUF4412 domain-containing protein [Antarcticibacterium]
MKKVLITGILVAFCALPLQAQFLKKLQKKVEQRVENTVTNKVADKAAAEAGKSMDNMLNFDFGKTGFAPGFEMVDVAEVPEVYEFEWRYVMTMNTAQGDMEMEYFLKKDAPYFGIRMPQNDVFMVMDHKRQMNVMYMNSGENKMVMATKMPELTAEDMKEAEEYNEEMSFKPIGSKEILGYDCKGFQAENEDMVYTFYVTSEPEISFNDIYRNENTQLPKGFDPQWLEDANGLMMQMIMEGKKKAKENVSMTCTALEKKPFSIQKNEYKSMAGE